MSGEVTGYFNVKTISMIRRRMNECGLMQRPFGNFGGKVDSKYHSHATSCDEAYLRLSFGPDQLLI